MKRVFFCIFTLSLLTTSSFAQEKETAQNDLNTQFNNLKEKAETYNDYKVLKESTLDEFWISVEDSLRNLNKKEVENNILISDLTNQIKDLQDASKASQSQFEENEVATTHIQFLGINFSKSTFKILVSVTISALILLIAIGFIQYNHNRRVASQKVADYANLETEYDELKRKSLEKQIQLKRELQTERNLVDDLRSKSKIRKNLSA